MTDGTYLSIESKNIDPEDTENIPLRLPSAGTKAATLAKDTSQCPKRPDTSSMVRLRSLPTWLNVELENLGLMRSVPRMEVAHVLYAGELGRRLEKNEDDFHRILGHALEVVEKHPVLRLRFPDQSLDIKHVACLLIGELIATGRLEGFEEGYERR